jgi:CheY-like chemotaxis protein
MGSHADTPILLKEDVVVVADDEMFSRFMTVELVERLGQPRVVVARDGDEALAALDTEDAALIRMVLLDFQMPGHNGLEVLKEIRCGRLQVAHDTVVLMVTGLDSVGLAATAMALDVDGFVAKPLSLSALREHLAGLDDPDRQIAEPGIYETVSVDEMGALGRPMENAPQVEGGLAMRVADLAEGMVLTRHVRSPEGVLLVAAGTRVTARLGRLLRGLAAAGLPLGCLEVAENGH